MKSSEGPEWLKTPSGLDLVVEGGKAQSVEVDLANEGQPFLERVFGALEEPEWNADEVAHTVWIDTGQKREPHESLPVFLGQELVGTLSGNATSVLRHDLRKAAKKNQPLILDGFLLREKDRLRLYVNLPA